LKINDPDKRLNSDNKNKVYELDKFESKNKFKLVFNAYLNFDCNSSTSIL